MIDFKDYDIQDRQIHILFPNQVHSWTLDSGTKGYQLMVDKECFERFSPHFRLPFAYYQRNPIITLSEETFILLRTEFWAIHKELDAVDCLSDIIHSRVAVIASILSKEVQRISSDVYNNPYSLRLIQLQELIEDNFRGEKSVAFYADKLHISTSQLSKICRQYLHVSPIQLIQQRLVLEAKRLLKSTDLSIKQIAFDLGFVDAPYFSNFFKQHVGMSPKEFKSE